mmetsp:Transcript_11892/g.37857  ORF Transcript_11892/g.37857 Transcript_11892/m.37857 type:complete len:153 (-) Transcript_11892:33-491(-)
MLTLRSRRAKMGAIVVALLSRGWGLAPTSRPSRRASPVPKSALLALSLVAVPVTATAQPAGEKLFEANCAVCHAGGGNVIVRSKSLDRADLEREGYDRSAIELIIARGRGAMPGFGAISESGRRAHLEEQEISEIAEYVEAQADAGWPLPAN